MEEQGLKFLIEIAILLIGANLGGILMEKFNQPSVLGQILAGLIIGPAIFNVITPNEIINSFSEIGVILLMFLAGIETNIGELKKSAGPSLIIAIGGVIFTFFGGFGIIMLLFPGGGITQASFTGVILTATSISITVQALKEFNKLKSKEGMSNLGAAILDDVIGIILIAVVIGIDAPQAGEPTSLVILKIVGFFVLAIVAGKLFIAFIKKISAKSFRHRNVAEFALILCLLLAFTAEEFGVSAIIGAYLTGLVFSLTPFENRINQDISKIAYTLFTPIFFVSIGLKVSFAGISDVILPALAIIAVAVITKIVGSGLGAKISGFNLRDSLKIGIGMIPRAEVALIVANLGRSLNLINDTIFTSVILMVVVTTLITPPLLKMVYKTKKTDKLEMAKK